MQGGPCWGELGEPALDGGVDVFVCLFEIELTRVELALDPPQAALDGGQLGPGQEACRGEAACVSDAPGDVERIQLEVDLQRRREPLELR